ESIRERSSRDEARLATLKADLSVEEEAREVAAVEAAHRRGEHDQALSELAPLQEQLAEQQVALQQCVGEIQRCTDSRNAAREELERRRSWLAGARQELESTRDVETGLERVLAEAFQVQGQLRLEEEEARQAATVGTAQKVELAASEENLAKQSERLEKAELQSEELRAETARAEQEEARLKLSVEQLRHDQAAGGGMRRNLEGELQMLLAEA
ncbi:unnamed protein product, partial [Polarella glacialis]